MNVLHNDSVILTFEYPERASIFVQGLFEFIDLADHM